MNLEEFYAQIGGDYADTLQRLCNENMVKKFVKKYQDDPTCANLHNAALQQDWEENEHSILAFVRHGDLDQVTLSIAKLPGYLRYGEIPSFAAEANTVRRMLIHIWESEQFVLSNIV